MTQFNPDFTGDPSGAQFLDSIMPQWRDALHSCHKGNTRPTYALPGTLWIDDSQTPWALNLFTGTDDVVLGTVDAENNLFTSLVPDNSITSVHIAPGAVLGEKLENVAGLSAGTYENATVTVDTKGRVVGIEDGTPATPPAQTWQNVTASRALATTYVNTTDSPIMVSVRCAASVVSARLYATVDGVEAAASNGQGNGSGSGAISGFIVPVGSQYTVNTTSGHTLSLWAELR